MSLTTFIESFPKVRRALRKAHKAHSRSSYDKAMNRAAKVMVSAYRGCPYAFNTGARIA